MSIDHVAVIGLGAMGGSLALDLAAVGVHVAGYDTNADTVAEARAAGITADLWKGQGVACDVVVIAVPVRRIARVLENLAPHAKYALVTDIGSTKRSVIDAATRCGLGACFVGSHPYAGTHESGWPAARARMLNGKTVFLTRTATTSPQAFLLAEELWALTGADTHEITAEEHDTQLAWTSHLPQLAADALALALRSARVRRAQLGPGGADMTRLAGSDPDLWLDVALTNADMLDEPLGCLIEALTEIRSDLRSGNEERVLGLLRASQAWYSA